MTVTIVIMTVNIVIVIVIIVIIIIIFIFFMFLVRFLDSSIPLFEFQICSKKICCTYSHGIKYC